MNRHEKDEHKLKEITEKSNLFQFVGKGFSVGVKINSKREALQRIKELLEVDKLLAQKQLDKLVKFLGISLKGAAVRIKLSPEETYKLILDQGKDANITYPDGIDLVDAIGGIISDLRIIDGYDKIPFVTHFINELHESGLFDLEVGCTTDFAGISLAFKTEGIKELFDLVMGGME